MSKLDFLNAIKKYRTSSNGMFGMKLHFMQFLHAFESSQINSDMINFLREANQLIWIKRRNKIYQAISQAIAIQSNVWSSEDPKFQKQNNINISNQLITNCLQIITFDELGWQKTLDTLKLDYLEVWYEDLAESYLLESKKVLNYLNIYPTRIPEEPIKKQGDELNEYLYKKYLGYITNI
jgi:LPS sulfotransferase NodH